MDRGFLQKILKFNEWHLTDSTERVYAAWIIRRINEMINEGCISGNGVIVEVGCGLGDIISGIRWKNKCGYDIEKSVVKGARIVHFGDCFKEGSFDSLNNEKIACLIAVNFMHRIEPEKLNDYFERLFGDNSIERVVVDKVSSPPYQFSHDYDLLMKNRGYVLEQESKGFIAMNRSRRRISIYKKGEDQ